MRSVIIAVAQGRPHARRIHRQDSGSQMPVRGVNENPTKTPPGRHALVFAFLYRGAVAGLVARPEPASNQNTKG